MPWDERTDPGSSASAMIQRLSEAAAKELPEASVLVVNPSAVPGIGFASGFEFVLQDRRGGDLDRFETVLNDLIARANERPELSRTFTFFATDVPTIEYELDRERAKSLGVAISDVFGALEPSSAAPT